MKKLNYFIATIILASTVIALVPQARPAQADTIPSLGGFLTGFLSTGTIFNGLLQGLAGANGYPLSGQTELFNGTDAGKSQPLAVPTSVENPLQPGIAYNKKQFLLDIAKSIASYAVNKAVQKYVQGFVDGTLTKYKVNSYLSYAINLADQAYVVDHMTGSSSVQRYITSKLINDINQNPFQTVNLSPIFTNVALQSFNYANIGQQKNILDVYAFNAQAGELRNTSGGQQTIAMDYASKVKADATAAANLSVMSGRGNKDSQFCQLATETVLKVGAQQKKNPLPTDYETISYPKCAVVNPGQYAAQHIDARLNGLLGLNTKPQDHLGELAKALSDLVGSKIFGNQILNPTGNIDTPLPDGRKVGL